MTELKEYTPALLEFVDCIVDLMILFEERKECKDGEGSSHILGCDAPSELE